MDGAASGENSRLPFEDWRDLFLKDAERCGLKHNAEMIGDEALRLFWSDGLEPSVRAMLERAKPAKAG